MDDKKGKVIILGAGPGDPGLITVRGKQAVESAEVLVYDYLANPLLLDSAPSGAERIYVGKKGAKHTMEQENINKLLADKAMEGKLVVRLKGGDPYIFGRGSEEAAHLREQGVDFEVIPGLPAALGASAYSGIPLTDRRHTSTLTFVTGHEDPTKPESSIDWAHLASNKGTIVFYMGVKNLPNIASNLIENGKPADTPVGIVEWATMPHQRVVRGTLSDIADIAAENKIHPPALIIVGGVNTLADKLDWFQRRPLFGKKIIVTRSRKQASMLSAGLRDLGADAPEMPTIDTVPPDDWSAVDSAIDKIENFDWIVFTSVNGVESFLNRIFESGGDVRRLSKSKIAAIGPATNKKLRDFGLNADLQPPKFVAESIVETLEGAGEIKGKNILLPRADIARKALPELLAEKGAAITDVSVYQTVPGDFDVESLKTMIESGSVDAVTFTSSSTANNFVDRLGEDFIMNNRDKFMAVSIGPITSEALESRGLKPAAEADEYTIPGLIGKLSELLVKKDTGK
ncbi:uroporphyrinogen-III C-methyltransferase [bacterium]